jgi:SAM-dependent methyltransferase
MCGARVSQICLACDSQSQYWWRPTPDDRFDFAKCQHCGHIQLSPLPLPDDAVALYDEEYFGGNTSDKRGYSAYVRNESGWRRMAARRLRAIRRLHSAAGALLDVGAATGFFVSEASGQGWDAVGIEPSRWAAQYAREVTGASVSAGTLEELPLVMTYDVITAWEVIEHVIDPAAFLVAARMHLRQDGIIAISTPIWDALVPRLLGRRWLGWGKVPEHISVFSRHSLAALLQRCGFGLLAMRLAPVDVSCSYLLERLLLQATGRPTRIQNRLLESVTVTINPGWDLMIAARAL